MNKLIITLMLTALCSIHAIADKVSDYKEYSSRVRAEVWADSLPQFSNPPKVPEKYRNESAVILAAHTDISAKKKTGIGFDRNASLIPLKKVALINMDDYNRKLVLINDKAALEKFSEYDMPVKSGSSDWFFQEKDERKYVLGVRIIKPDGTIIEVPTDDFVILSQQKKENKADRQKLAVPGLEIGDKLDIFLFTHTALKNIQPEPIDIMFRQDYPVLSHTVKCKIDDDLTTLYRQRNGAPGLKVTQDADKDFVITTQISEPLDAEPQLLYSSEIQSPHLEMIIYNRRFDEYTPHFARKDGIQANPDAETTVIANGVSRLENFTDMTLSVKKQLSDVKGNPMKEVKKKFKEGKWSQARTAEYIYNLLVFSYMTGKYRYYPGDFVNELDAAFRNADIKNIRKGVVTSRNHVSIDSLINYKDIWFFVYLPDTKQFFSNAFRGYNTSSEILPSLQGQDAMLTHDKKLSKQERESENRRFTVPLNSPYDNRRIVTINASIDGTDMNINRRVDAFGAAKDAVGPILTSDNLLNAYLEYLNQDGIVADPQMLRKEKSKDKQARLERNADESKEQSDRIRKMTSDYHGFAPKEFKDYEILACGIGLSPDSAAISYAADYIMDGIVKRAGQNLTLGIGNLLPKLPQIAPSQRNRLPGDNILLPYPQLNITNVCVELPQGYTISAASLAKLNSQLSNKAGSLVSKAEVTHGKLTVSVTLEFPHINMPASDWQDMLTLTEKATDLTSTTLILEK